jgi:nickel/cobalt exporter
LLEVCNTSFCIDGIGWGNIVQGKTTSAMYSILIGSLLLSLLHAVIPSHWLPVLAIGRKENWTMNEVTRVTFLSGFAHALSTIIIGVIIGLLGLKLTESVQNFSHIVAPLVLILLGIFFIYQHHRHKHFHLHNQPRPALSKSRIIITLVVAMFFSPCMEIEAYFLLAGSFGWYAIISVAILYLTISVSGMVLWIRLAYKGILKLNWHKLEHNAGIITGLTLIITGILTFFIH